jgi:hypothetical protein
MLSQLYRAIIHTKNTDGSADMFTHYMAKFPFVLVTQVYAAAMFNGHWSTLPLQQESRAFGQNINLLTFAPARAGTAKYNTPIDETNAILGEELVGAVSSHRTKAKLQLFSGGAIHHYTHLMATVANAILVLLAADDPTQETESVLVRGLKELFHVLSMHDVQFWVEQFTRQTTGDHLPYAIALDINNNSIVHLAQFANDARWIQAVSQGADIPASALDYYRSVHNCVIANLQRASGSDSLGSYQSPPSTWISPRVKKAAKTTETSSPSGARQQMRSAPTNQHQATASHQQAAHPRTTTSNPDFGMLLVPDHIRNGPQLASGKRLCLLFAAKTRSCSNRSTCNGEHVTSHTASIPDLRTIDRWVTDTPNASWVHRPAILRNHHTTTPSHSGSPAATMPSGQVSPSASTSATPNITQGQ